MTASKKIGIDPALSKAIAKLLKDTMSDTNASLTDKCKAVDRALKLEQIRHKLVDEGYGSGFFTNEDSQGG